MVHWKNLIANYNEQFSNLSISYIVDLKKISCRQDVGQIFRFIDNINEDKWKLFWIIFNEGKQKLKQQLTWPSRKHVEMWQFVKKLRGK